jgi:hypothetical protein
MYARPIKSWNDREIQKYTGEHELLIHGLILGQSNCKPIKYEGGLV